VDYSGEYYIRNVGSGRYLHEVGGGSSGVVSTTYQPDNHRHNRFKLIRREDGSYRIENKATRRAFSGLGWPNVRSDGGNNYYPISLINQEDGSFKLKLSSDFFIIENSSTKSLQYKSTNLNHYDYDKFTLESVWETPPIDLNKEYFIRVKTSGRYLRAWNGSASTSPINAGNEIKFALRRRAGGYYDITSKSTGKRLRYSDDEYGRYTTAYCSNCEEDNYLFSLEKADSNNSWTTPDGSYTIKNKSSGKYLQEFFDVETGPIHRNIVGISEPNDGYANFFLDDSFQTSTDYSGEYLIQAQESGRYLYDDGDFVSTLVQGDANSSRFVLKKVDGPSEVGQYEIWNRASLRRMHVQFQGSRLTTANDDNISDDDISELWHYACSLYPQDDGSFRSSSVLKIHEKLDLDYGEEHRYLASAGRRGVIDEAYSRFRLINPADFNAEHEDLSGEYLIRVKGSGRYLNAGNNIATADDLAANDSPTLFVLRRRMNLQEFQSGVAQPFFYEIWSKETGTRLRQVSDSNYKAESGASTVDDYLYRLSKRDDGSIQIIHKNTGQKLFEHFEPGSSNDKKLRSAQNTANHYASFLLDKSVEVSLNFNDLEGAALNFDGINDYVELENETSFDFTNALTIEAWVKVEAFNKTWQAVVTKGDNAWRLHRYRNSNKIAFSTNGLSNLTLSSNADINDSQWHHIAAVYDGDHKYLYIDGVLDAETAAVGTISRNNFKVQIGENAQQRNRYFKGHIDEVCIWNIARSQSKIQNNMAQNLTGFETGLAAYYNFNNGTPCGDNRDKIELQDQSSSNNNAFLRNFGLRGDECPSNWVQNYERSPVPDLSDAYYLQVRGSGHYLDLKDNGTAFANKISNGHKKFIFKKQGDGIYEIIYNGSRLHAQKTGNTWTYTTTANAGLAEEYYQFRLIQSTSNSYKIKCLASQNYIFENFAPNGSEHQLLLSASNEPDEYGFFELKSVPTPSPDNLSGEHLFKVTDSGRYIHCSGLEIGGLLSTNSQANDDYIRFWLKRKAEEGYEIWSKENSQRLHASRPGLNWMFTAKEENGLTKEHYLFSLTESSGFYTIKSIKTNEYLYENNVRGIASSSSPTTNHIIELAASYVFPNDVSGEYFLRSQGSGRHLYNSGQRIETSAEVNSNGIRFLLKKQTDGSYKIQSKSNLGYLHLASGNTYKASGDGEGNTYKFNLTFDANNGYRLQCKANNEYLYEYFDLALGDQHQQILSAPNPDPDYSHFFLESEYETPPQNLSGKRYIITSNSERYLFMSSNNTLASKFTTQNDEALKFVLKRRASGKYEIWNRATVASNYQPVNSKTTGMLWSSSIVFARETTLTTNSNKYLFEISNQSDSSYIIRNTAEGFLYNSNTIIKASPYSASQKFRIEAEFGTSE
ncbi:MAG: hypothetical protein ACJATF_004374, partial [Flavobacteriales bacterium]